MAYSPRRTSSARDKAEALFKAATKKPSEATEEPRKTAVPAARESVTLRIDHDVLEHFQDQGPGWQDRINRALRKATGL